MITTTARRLTRQQSIRLLALTLIMLTLCWFRIGPPVFVSPIILATVFTNAGKAIVTNRLKGSGTEPNFCAIGTGAGTAAVADTTLFTEVETRVAGTSTQVLTTVTNDTYQVVGTISITGTRGVTNAGLFDAATVGNMLIKGDFAVINLVSGDSLQLTGKLAFA
jgi:hypothetical protein